MSAGILPGPEHVVEADCQTETIGLITRQVGEPEGFDIYGCDIYDFICIMEMDVYSLPCDNTSCSEEMEKLCRRLTDILSNPHILHLPITRAHLTQMLDYVRQRREELLGEMESNAAPGASGASIATASAPGIVGMMISSHTWEYAWV
jgi:hypothetical protein